MWVGRMFAGVVGGGHPAGAGARSVLEHDPDCGQHARGGERECGKGGSAPGAGPNAQAEMIMGVVVTAENAPDNKPFVRWVARDRAQELAVETYAADRGYDDTENHYGLASLGLHSVIRLKRTCTGKRDGNQEM